VTSPQNCPLMSSKWRFPTNISSKDRHHKERVRSPEHQEEKRTWRVEMPTLSNS
jgi:hypothetical protein